MLCFRHLMIFIAYVSFTAGLIHWVGSRTQAASGFVSGCVRLLVFTVAFIKLKRARTQLSHGELGNSSFLFVSSPLTPLFSSSSSCSFSPALNFLSLPPRLSVPLLSLANTLLQYALIREAYSLFSAEKC